VCRLWLVKVWQLLNSRSGILDHVFVSKVWLCLLCTLTYMLENPGGSALFFAITNYLSLLCPYLALSLRGFCYQNCKQSRLLTNYVTLDSLPQCHFLKMSGFYQVGLLNLFEQ
jgi:hypothetical protein